MLRLFKRPVRLAHQAARSRPLQTRSNRWMVYGGLGCISVYAAVDKDFRDSVVHSVRMVDRVTVVGATTVRCALEYKRVLLKEYALAEERNEALSKCHAKCANMTYRALSHNGGVYIKLGQHLTALTYLLPPEWPEAMLPLQDRCPRLTLEEIEEMFETDLGVPLLEVVKDMNPDPIGVASLAQVHTGILKETGEQVAVKFQHPSLKEFVPLDVALTRGVFNTLAYLFPEYDLRWLSDELENGIFIELDFRIEQRNAEATRKYFEEYKSLTALRIPKVFWATQRVLAMEYIPGHRLDDLEFLDKNHILRAEVSVCLAHIFNNMIFTPGVGIHCDPHGGNLAIRPYKEGKHNFEIVLYDHGQYRNVNTPMRRAYARMWLALLDLDPALVKKYAQEFCGVSDENFPLFAAGITGRDFEHALTSIKTPRTQEEIDGMTRKLTQGLLADLMRLLRTLPSIVLLILKTNDLVRSLDESLHSPIGQEGGFLVMAWYCARTVFEEDKENLKDRRGLLWLWGYLRAFWSYEKRVLRLEVYEWVLKGKSLF